MTEHPNTEHIDDEAISASLDGEPQPHLESCAQCRARADELRAAADAIGAVPLVDADRREAAISAALRRPERWRPPMWVAGVAAAAVAAVVLVGVLAGSDHSEKSNSSAAAPKYAQERDAASEPRLVAPSAGTPSAGGGPTVTATATCEPELRRRDPSLLTLVEHHTAPDGRSLVLEFQTSGNGRRTYTLDPVTCADVTPPVSEGATAPPP